MNKNFVRTLALVGMVGMMSSTGLVAHAAEAPATAQTQTAKQTVDAKVAAQVFDAKYYAETYPDVVAVLGNDPVKLLNHYIKNGIKEGRDASATFNASTYAIANPDLIEVFGDDFNMLITHYVVSGKSEGRIASTTDFTNLSSRQMNALLAQSAQTIKAKGYENSFKIATPTASLPTNPTATGYDKNASWVNPAMASYQSTLQYINNGGTIDEATLKRYKYAAEGIYYNPVTGETQEYGTTKYVLSSDPYLAQFGIREFTRVSSSGIVTSGWNVTDAQRAAMDASPRPREEAPVESSSDDTSWADGIY